ncbi:MAG: ATP-binding protein [Deltaproteobacteria bacterium]|jgi:hypothetical protein|nr:ATP-binding protein [Deltaproteobacteria bacterium]
MAETGLKRSPFGVGEARFEMIINNRGVYVDKTGLIHDLISSYWQGAPYFLSRPRRFGKTLLLDTIKCVFQGKRELFSGLEIERRAGFNWDAFPVIHISLNNTTPEQDLFEPTLLDEVKTVALKNGVVLDSVTSSSAIANLIVRLSLDHKSSWKKQGKDPRLLDNGNVVLLIDEYDYPLISNIGNPQKQEKIRLALRNFFSSIKRSLENLRFTFITGVTKFRQVSLFSSMNTIEDISLDEHFSTICGFTKLEIETSFSRFLSQTLSDLKSKSEVDKHADIDSLVDQVMKWYDGYSWDGKSKVLNPLSVLKFFRKKKFSNYWYQTGSSLLTSRVANNTADYFKIFSKDLEFSGTFPEMDLNNLNDTILLMQAGYLTIDSVTSLGSRDIFNLTIPSYEIMDSIRLEILADFFVPPNIPSPDNYLNRKCLQFLNAFSSRNEGKCEFFLSAILAGIIQRGPGSPKIQENQHFQDDQENQDNHEGENEKYQQATTTEFLFRTILQLLIEFGNQLVIPESFSDIGRSDLAVQSSNGWVAIEIKHENADSTHEKSHVSLNKGDIVLGRRSEYVNGRLEKMINQAFIQIVQKNYAKKYLADGFDVYAAAVAVYGTSEVMVRFRKVVWEGSRKINIAVE